MGSAEEDQDTKLHLDYCGAILAAKIGALFLLSQQADSFSIACSMNVILQMQFFFMTPAMNCLQIRQHWSIGLGIIKIEKGLCWVQRLVCVMAFSGDEKMKVT